MIIGYNACNSLTSSNNLCIGSNGNNLITGNFNTGIVVLGSTSGYAHVPGDLYVGGTIYEGTNPSNSNDNGGKSNDDSNGGANASDNQGSDSNEDFDLVIDRDPDDGSGGNSDDIRREVEKYAKLNSRLNAEETTFQSLQSDIDSNTQAISSLQNYVQELHTDMNAGFAMSAAISAKVFPDVKGWSLSGGVGYYENQEAFALGVNYISDDFGFTVNLAQSQREEQWQM